VDLGKVAVVFVDTQTGRAVRMSADPSARERACDYEPGALTPWHAQLAAYQAMAETDLLRVEPVRLTLSMEALISKPGLRVVCRGCGEEVMNERELWVDGGSLCRRCAGFDRYYEADAPGEQEAASQASAASHNHPAPGDPARSVAL
jgi:formylmethanofuran dehydrogenase subunit E